MNNMEKRYFTSESVTEGHPDKVCDQIADAILDAVLAQDPNGRVACEVCANTDLVLVMGEISTNAHIDVEQIVRKTVCDIGYNQPDLGFDGNTCRVQIELKEQSSDIALGVDLAREAKAGNRETQFSIGAGDQGMMFGYACNETPALIPYSITAAHSLAYRLAQVRKNGLLPYLRPDGKTQVTIECDAAGEPRRVENIVISAQHDPDVSPSDLEQDLRTLVIEDVLPMGMIDRYTKILINPTGRFVTGGPAADSGLTGRKIIVDTYGGYAHHGGGAFSGKDPTKVDRTAAYYARYAAKNVVAAGLAKRCEIQLSYAIGVAEPTSLRLDTFGTGAIPDDEILELVRRTFDFRPAAMIHQLGLRTPIYQQTAAYGHFGRPDLELPWEKIDRI